MQIDNQKIDAIEFRAFSAVKSIRVQYHGLPRVQISMSSVYLATPILLYVYRLALQCTLFIALQILLL